MVETIGDFGLMFHLTRVNSGLHQRELMGAGVAVQTVSRFENKRSDLSLSSVISLLQEVPVTMHEFLITSTGTFPDSFDEFLQYVGVLGVTRDADEQIAGFALRCRILYAMTKNVEWRMRAAMLAPSGDIKVQEQERKLVLSYLMRVDDWTSYEFILLRRTLCTGVLLWQDIPQLWPRLHRFNREEHRMNYTRQRMQLVALLSVADLFMEARDFEWLDKVLTVTRQLPVRSGDICAEFHLRALEAEQLLLCPGADHRSGAKLLHELYHSAKFIGAPQIVARLEAISVATGTDLRKMPQKV